MINIPPFNKFYTDDQVFYDTQINEELKYCACSNYVIKYTEVGKNKSAIQNEEGKAYLDFYIAGYEINPRQLLYERGDELGNYLINNNKLEDYEKLKQMIMD